MTASTCTCRARVGERHYRACPLFPAVRQPLPKMEGHPSLYRTPPMSVEDQERFQHRLDNMDKLDGCGKDNCEICYGSPFVSEDGHRE